jgi:hypothetical protein
MNVAIPRGNCDARRCPPPALHLICLSARADPSPVLGSRSRNARDYKAAARDDSGNQTANTVTVRLR